MGYYVHDITRPSWVSLAMDLLQWLFTLEMNIQQRSAGICSQPKKYLETRENRGFEW